MFLGFGIPALAFSVLLVPLLIFMWKGYSLRRRHVAPPLDRTALPTTSLQLTPPTHRYAVIVGRRGPSCCAGLCCGAQRRPSEVLPREAAENPEAERVAQARRKFARRLARLPPLGLNFSSAEVRGVATEDDHSIVKEATSANGHYAGLMVFWTAMIIPLEAFIPHHTRLSAVEVSLALLGPWFHIWAIPVLFGIGYIGYLLRRVVTEDVRREDVLGLVREDVHRLMKEATSANCHYAGFMVFGAVSIWMIHGATSTAIAYMTAPASLDEEVPPPWCVQICESGEIWKLTLWLHAGTSAVTSAFRS